MVTLAFGVAAAAGAAAVGLPPGLGFGVGVMAGNYLFGGSGDNQIIEGPRVRDSQAQDSAHGKPIPIIYGSARAIAEVIWSTPLFETVIESTQSVGKGGGGGTVTNRSYFYTRSWASMVCEGPVTGVNRIWADGKLIYGGVPDDCPTLEDPLDGVQTGTIPDAYDYPDESPFPETRDFSQYIRIYLGTADQQPDPAIVADKGDAPAYRYRCYIVFEDFPLEDFGNRIPNITVEISRGPQFWERREMSLPFNFSTPNQVTVNDNPIARGESVYSPDRSYRYYIAQTWPDQDAFRQTWESNDSPDDADEWRDFYIANPGPSQFTPYQPKYKLWGIAKQNMTTLQWEGDVKPIRFTDETVGYRGENQEVRDGIAPIYSGHPYFEPAQYYSITNNSVEFPPQIPYRQLGGFAPSGEDEILVMIRDPEATSVARIDMNTGVANQLSAPQDWNVGLGHPINPQGTLYSYPPIVTTPFSTNQEAETGEVYTMVMYDTIGDANGIEYRVQPYTYPDLAVGNAFDPFDGWQAAFDATGQSDYDARASVDIDPHPMLMTPGARCRGFIATMLPKRNGTAVDEWNVGIQRMGNGVPFGSKLLRQSDIWGADEVAAGFAPEIAGFFYNPITGFLYLILETQPKRWFTTSGADQPWKAADILVINPDTLQIENTTYPTSPFNMKGRQEQSSYWMDAMNGTRLHLPGEPFDYDNSVIHEVDLLDLEIKETFDTRLESGAWTVAMNQQIIHYDENRELYFALNKEDVYTAGDQSETGGTYITARTPFSIYRKAFSGFGGKTTLQAIVEDISVRAGLDPSQIDASELAGIEVRGYMLTRRSSAQSHIAPLLPPYFFDLVESDWQIKAKLHDRASSATLALDDLSPHEPGNDMPDSAQRTDLDPYDLVRAVEIVFNDRCRDYQNNKARVSVDQALTRSNHTQTLDVPVIFDNGDEPRQRAEIYMTKVRFEHPCKFGVSAKYFNLELGDVVTVNSFNGSILMRITSLAEGVNGIMEVGGMVTQLGLSSSLTSYSEPIRRVSTKEPPPSEYILIDTPVLSACDQAAALAVTASIPITNFLIAATGTGKAWGGGVLYQSRDGGASWQAIQQVDSPSIMGKLVEDLPAGPQTVPDESNEIVVRLTLSTAALASISFLQFTQTRNAAVIGNETDGWEIVQFQNATQIDDRTWRLSNLLRGRKGTEAWNVEHKAGDTFALLERGPLAEVVLDANDIDKPLLYKFASAGRSFATVPAKTFADSAIVSRPMAPVIEAHTWH